MRKQRCDDLSSPLKRGGAIWVFVLLVFCGLISLMGLGSALTAEFGANTPIDGSSNKSIIINISSDATDTSYAFVNFNNSLVGWWTMETNLTGGVIDRGPNSINCSNVTAYSSAGYWGNGSFLNGSAYYNCGDKNEVEGLSKITISLWARIYQDISNTNENISQTFINKNSVFYMGSIDTAPASSVKFRLRVYNGTTSSIFDTTSVYSAYSWHHLVGVYNGTNLLLYIDGTLDSASPPSLNGLTATNANNLFLGGATSTFSLNGTIDDILIFNRALSSSEILSLNNATANKYNIDFSSIWGVGNTQNITGYVINSTGAVVNTAQRILTMIKGVSSVRPYEERYYQSNSVVWFNATTNFDASCVYSLNFGQNNYTMASTNNRDFNASNSSIPQGNYTLFFYCNDSTNLVSSSINFFVMNHLIYYVNKNVASCSNSYDKNYASNEITPLCNISTAIGLVSSGNEVVIKYGDYCEGIDPWAKNVRGIDGTAEYPIIIRGESDTQRTILNGTCAPQNPYAEGIAVYGHDFWNFKYFYISNFSSDGMNVHANGTDNSLNITFENITTFQTGYSGKGVVGGSAGDGISFHENCTGIGKWLNFSYNWKSGIVDISGSQTNYENIYIESPEDYGVYFTESTDSATHYLTDIVVKNSPNWCISSDSNLTVDNLICLNNSNNQIVINDDYVNIYNFNISETEQNNSIKIQNADFVELINGSFDGGIIIVNSPQIILTNVTYNSSLESISSGSLTRKWYYKANVTDSSGNAISGATIQIYNSSNSLVQTITTDANGSIDQISLIDYINNGTRTYSSPYTINISKSGYDTTSYTRNLTSLTNTYDTFILSLTATTSTSTSGSGFPSFNPTTEQIQKGFEKVLYVNWKVKFKIGEENHTLIVNNINKTSNSATITISSAPQTVTLLVGEEKKFNFNEDNYYDLLVKLNSISGAYGNFTIKTINETITSLNNNNSTSETNEPILNKGFSKSYSLLIFLIIIAVIIIGIVVFIKIKKK